MSGRIKKSVPFIVLVVACVVVYCFRGNLLGGLEELHRITAFDFALISFFVIATTVVNGIQNNILVRQFGLALRTAEWFGLSVVSTFWNYLPFQGGVIAKGLYLKRKHDFFYSDYLALTTASYLFTFIILGIIGCFGLAASYAVLGTFSAIVFLIYLGVFLVPAAAVWFFVRRNSPRLQGGVADRFYHGLQLILSRRHVVFKLFLVNVVMVACYALRLMVVSVVLGYNISFLFYLLVSPVALLSIFTAITPGGLVVREALLAVFAGWMAVSVSDTVAVAVLDRIVSMGWIFILGIIFNYYLTRRAIGKNSGPNAVAQPPADQP